MSAEVKYMQDYRKIMIDKEQIVPIAERMHKAGIYLVMIHGFINSDGLPDISYDYAVECGIESYHVIGEDTLPSVSEIYCTAAVWPERELNELFGISFEGLDVSKRLFLPEDMLETRGKGQIMVTPLAELREKNINQEV